MMNGKRILPDIDIARFFFDSCGGVLDESSDSQIDPRYILSCQVQRRKHDDTSKVSSRDGLLAQPRGIL